MFFVNLSRSSVISALTGEDNMELGASRGHTLTHLVKLTLGKSKLVFCIAVLIQKYVVKKYKAYLPRVLDGRLDFVFFAFRIKTKKIASMYCDPALYGLNDCIESHTLRVSQSSRLKSSNWNEFNFRDAAEGIF